MGNHEYKVYGGSGGCEDAGPYRDHFSTYPKDSNDNLNYSFDIDNIHFVSFDNSRASTETGNPPPFRSGSDSYQWLESNLVTTSAEWKIVLMHVPAYSCGKHGSSSMVRNNLVSLFENQEVDLVITGHDHSYQRFIPINGVTHIVSAGGGAPLYDIDTVNCNEADLLAPSEFDNGYGNIAVAKKYHVTRFDIKDDVLCGQAIDINSAAIDRFSLPAGQWDQVCDWVE